MFYLLLIGIAMPKAGAQAVIDFFTNKSYETNQPYIELNLDREYLKSKIDIGYSTLLQTDNQAFKRINTSILDICKSFVEKESRFMELQREADKRVDFYGSMYYPVEENEKAHLIEVKTKALSATGGQMLYEISFRFNTISKYRNDGIAFDIKRYYLADLATGEVKSWKPNIPAKAIKVLEKIAGSYFIRDYRESRLRRRYEGDDDNEDEVSDRNASVDAATILKNIRWADADIFWNTYGLVVQFQDYTQKHFNKGDAYSVFIPYEEALKITTLMPEFNFINRQPKVAGSIQNFDGTYDVHYRYTKTDHYVTDFIGMPGQPSVKTLVNLFYTNNGIKKSYVSKKVYEYNREQKLISQVTYNEKNIVTDSIHNVYNSQGKRIKTVHTTKEGTLETLYFHDANGNITKKFTPWSERFYFYNANFVYTFGNDQPEDNVVLSTDGNKWCNGSGMCSIEDRGQIIAMVVEKNYYRESQSGRDKHGNIIETYWDNDNEYAYFNYDALNRLTGVNRKSGQQRTYSYADNGYYPSGCVLEKNYNDGVEEYFWTLY